VFAILTDIPLSPPQPTRQDERVEVSRPPFAEQVVHDVIVLGAGIAGLAAMDRLTGTGGSILCLESFDRIGGSHRSVEAGGYTFDIGSFVFHANHPFFQTYPEVREQMVPFAPGQQRLAPDGKVRRYPYASTEIFGGALLSTVLDGLSFLSGRLRFGEVGNADAYARKILGRRLYERLGLRNYMERFYGSSAELIDRSFVDDRMKFVLRAVQPAAMAGTIAQLVRSKVSAPKPAPKRVALARPRAGFEALYAPVVKALEDKGARFVLGAGTEAIRRVSDGFEITTAQGVYRCARLVNTLPLHVLWPLLKQSTALELESSRLTSLFVSFSGDRGFTAPILFNFHGEGRWKRLTLHSHFYGDVEGRAYFSVEVPQSAGDPVDAGALFDDFRRHTAANGLFNGDLALEGHAVTDFAYPHYAIGYKARLAKAFAALEAAGIETVGRQGRFDYLPTTHQVVGQVRRELDQSTASA